MILLQQDYDKLQFNMKISKKVLNTEFAGSSQSVKALSKDTAFGNRRTLIAITKRLMKKTEQASNFFVFSQMSTFNNLLKMHKL